MLDARLLEHLWWGTGVAPRAGRAVLLPLAAAYAGVIALRTAFYDAGLLPACVTRLPAISIGNITVGGTGKTPVAAWVAAQIAARDARPAIVLRGYGGDEPRVHAALNPAIPVVVAPDRLRGIDRAAALGADIAVLDDAFQHRRAGRLADIVLVSADRWTSRRWPLPAGPWREPLESLSRASLVAVTRKAASPSTASAISEKIGRLVPSVPVTIVHLAVQELRALGGTSTMALQALAGARVSAIAAIGDPRAFLRQLAATGATIRPNLFRDHHAYTAADASRLAASLQPGEIALCTLKDAVKLAQHWPREAPTLWYVSQHVVVEEGRPALDSLLTQVLEARSVHP